MMKNKTINNIGVISLGCAKNRVDCEVMIQKLLDARRFRISEIRYTLITTPAMPSSSIPAHSSGRQKKRPSRTYWKRLLTKATG